MKRPIKIIVISLLAIPVALILLNYIIGAPWRVAWGIILLLVILSFTFRKQKFVKITAIVLSCLVLAVFINGTCYVFKGQEKSMAKLQNNQELSIYECCSIYTMHIAVWMFGWPLSPEAASEAYRMHFKVDNDIRWSSNTDFLNSKVVTSNPNFKEKKPFKVSWPIDLTQIPKDELKYALAYNTNNTQVLFTQNGNPILEYTVEYQNVKYDFGCIPIYTGLFKYLQEIGWLHPYKMVMCSVTTYFDDILGLE